MSYQSMAEELWVMRQALGRLIAQATEEELFVLGPHLEPLTTALDGLDRSLPLAAAAPPGEGWTEEDPDDGRERPDGDPST